MVPEAKLEHARENRWYHADGRAALCDLEGDRPFPQLGININVLEPGQSIGLYHWEAGQRTSSSSPARRCCSSRSRSGRCGSGISSTAHRGRTT